MDLKTVKEPLALFAILNTPNADFGPLSLLGSSSSGPGPLPSPLHPGYLVNLKPLNLSPLWRSLPHFYSRGKVHYSSDTWYAHWERVSIWFQINAGRLAHIYILIGESELWRKKKKARLWFNQLSRKASSKGLFVVVGAQKYLCAATNANSTWLIRDPQHKHPELRNFHPEEIRKSIFEWSVLFASVCSSRRSLFLFIFLFYFKCNILHPA